MQLVFPFKAKRSVVVSATVVTFSAIAHSAIFWLPMPQPDGEDLSSTAMSSQDEDVAVVILPQSETSPPPSEPTTETTPPPSSESAATPVPEPATLLPTDVIEEPVVPPPTTADLPPHPIDLPPIEDLPIENGDTDPSFTPPVNEGPLLSYDGQFPHFPGATSGCLGLGECRQVNGIGTYRNVANSLVAGLEDQGYMVNLRDDLEDTGRNVYELIPPGDGGTRQFLLVFQGEESGSAIYVMSPEIMTLDELKSLAAAQVTDRRQAV